ncbi:hypothetical protein F5883DRAFT_573349 [Diaporthe sp. PMI_573]|nr:hypothetical protein F5883DRAFT_577696 [Diaporthaceae sp. PMI_573]KAH8754640.1 hypothetical protein F5883DRAFT_573349 [Diaporthaceae sp. PMI_573]
MEMGTNSVRSAPADDLSLAPPADPSSTAHSLSVASILRTDALQEILWPGESSFMCNLATPTSHFPTSIVNPLRTMAAPTFRGYNASPHSLSPPQSLLVPENLFRHIRVYLEKSCRSMIFFRDDEYGKTQDGQTLTSPVSCCLSSFKPRSIQSRSRFWGERSNSQTSASPAPRSRQERRWRITYTQVHDDYSTLMGGSSMGDGGGGLSLGSLLETQKSTKVREQDYQRRWRGKYEASK